VWGDTFTVIDSKPIFDLENDLFLFFFYFQLPCAIKKQTYQLSETPNLFVLILERIKDLAYMQQKGKYYDQKKQDKYKKEKRV